MPETPKEYGVQLELARKCEQKTSPLHPSENQGIELHLGAKNLRFFFFSFRREKKEPRFFYET